MIKELKSALSRIIHFSFVDACYLSILLSVTVEALNRISSKLNISAKLNNSYWSVSQSSCRDGRDFNINKTKEIRSLVKCNCLFLDSTICHVTNMYGFLFLFFRDIRYECILIKPCILFDVPIFEKKSNLCLQLYYIWPENIKANTNTSYFFLYIILFSFS